MNTVDLKNDMVYRLGSDAKVVEQINDRLSKMPNEDQYFTGSQMVSKKQYLQILNSATLTAK
jgi:hypothetical protein